MQGAFPHPGRRYESARFSRTDKCDQRFDVGKIVVIALEINAMVANAAR
jgi:hypothetical protein